MRARYGESQEADQAEWRQIGFVLDEKRELLQPQNRKVVIQALDKPRNDNDADCSRDEDGRLAKPCAVDRQALTTVRRVSGSCADNEEELPGEGIEIPRLVVRVAVQLPTEPQVQEGGLNRSTQHFILKERWSVL